MEKIKKYYICDRCKKEIAKEDINYICDGLTMYNYELCKECKETYKEFNEEYRIL